MSSLNSTSSASTAQNPKSQIERLLNKEFSGDTEKMFNALQGQLKKEALDKSSFDLMKEKNRGVCLRAFIKGLNTLRAERLEGQSLTNPNNLFSFGKNGKSRGVEAPVAISHIGSPSSPRFPLPSLSSIARHLTDYTEIKVIRSKHMRILKLDLEGLYSRKEIAKMVGCSEPTITNVLSSESIQQFKRRSQSQMEDEYSSLMKPSIAAIRDSLKPEREINLRQDTAFKYLKTQGKGIDNYIRHDHRHQHTGADGGPILVSDVKQKMLQKLGYSSEQIIDAQFKEIKEVKAGD